MTFLHGRWRRQVALRAADALDAGARERVEAHLAGCAECRQEEATLRDTLALLARDPLRGAEPPIPLGALRARVLARLDAPASAATPSRAWASWALGAAAAAALAVVILRPHPPAHGPVPTAASPAVAETDGAGDEAFLRRLERVAAREQAARYLDEASDVLVTVAARPRRCRKGHDHVDIGEEAQRSRELLARRSLLDVDAAAVASAQPVLDDVEQVLREVASLEACARKHDLQAIQRQVERRRLLLKIDLMTRELQG
jgi:putative zinc finger protein